MMTATNGQPRLDQIDAGEARIAADAAASLAVTLTVQSAETGAYESQFAFALSRMRLANEAWNAAINARTYAAMYEADSYPSTGEAGQEHRP